VNVSRLCLGKLRVASTSNHERRIEKLEEFVTKLAAVATSAYIALSSLPPRITKEDPGFGKAMEKMSDQLDEVLDLWSNLTVNEE
jgi:hypothetical protein